MSGPNNQPLGHVWLSQEDLRTARGPAPDHAPLSPQSSIASSGSGGSEHLEEAGLGGGSGLHRSSFHEEGSGMRGECGGRVRQTTGLSATVKTNCVSAVSGLETQRTQEEGMRSGLVLGA